MRSLLKIRRLKSRRLIAAWLGIFALTVPMLAPIAQGIPLPAEHETDHQAPFYMVLCKAMQDGTGDEHEKNRDMTDCAVCLSFAFGNTVLNTPLAENPALFDNASTFTAFAQEQARRGLSASRNHARAPPSFG